MNIKTRKQVQHTLSPLDKVAVCARVVLAAVHPQQADLEAALAELKSLLGSQWTTHHAVQFLSGKAADAAILMADTPELQSELGLARRVARDVAASSGIASVKQ